MKQAAVLKNDVCPVCFSKRGKFTYKEVEGLCKACVVRMMFTFDLTVKGGSLTRKDGACFCCHRQVDPDAVHGGACLFCRRVGLVYLGAHKTKQKINKRVAPAFPPQNLSKKEFETFRSNPVKYLDMFWDVPAGTEWE